MRIQHNILAMNSYRNYSNNTNALGKNLEKLSSGYKINRAGDDAAGLAISEKMRAQIKGLDAAQKNVKDGISLVKTAEGAMQEIQDMLSRMKYLATQSANGTYDNDVDRYNLQMEVDELLKEIDRIADNANFNGKKLLDGSLDDGKIKLAGSAEYEVTFDDLSSLGLDGLTFEGLNENIKSIKIEVADGDSGDNHNAGVEAAYSDGELTITLTKKDGTGQTLAAQFTDDAGLIEEIQKAINGLSEDDLADLKVGGSFTIGDVDSASAGTATGTVAEAKAAEDAKNYGSVFDSAALTALGASNDFSIEGLTEDITSIEFVVAAAGNVTDSPKVAAAVNSGKLTITLTQGGSIGGETFEDDVSDIAAAIQAEIRKISGLENATINGSIGGAEIDAATPGTTALATGTVEEVEDEDGEGGGKGLQLQIGDTSKETLTVSVGEMHHKTMGLENLSIKNEKDASKSIDKVKNAINYVSSVRGRLGAVQNRLEHTANNLSVMAENIQDAESTIRDTDVADEMMGYVKNNILVQSAQAMLAQANQVPQGVLQLLG